MSKTNPSNLLIQEIEEEREKELRTKAKDAIKLVLDQISKRREWIKIRQEQILKLEDIQSRVYKAYDEGDSIAIDKCTKEANDFSTYYGKPAPRKFDVLREEQN